MDRVAQEWRNPTDITVAVDIPETYTGVSLWVVVSSPRRPLSLFPQQRALPLDRVAQVWASPAEMDVAVVIPET